MVASTRKMCACGKPLHYTDRTIQAQVAKHIAVNGEYLTVDCEGKTYSVQRHYIALHGLAAAELEDLADRGIVTRLA